MQYDIIPCTESDAELMADQINAVTDAMIGFEDTIEEELIVFKVNDADGNIIAGCNLLISCWKAADLDILWVAEPYRRQGIGSALIRKAERAARERGCRLMTLGTFDFQARPLYEKHGFTVCGTIRNCPTEGHTHYDMIKRLDLPCAEYVPAVSCAYEIIPGSAEDAEFIDDRLVEYNWSKIPAAHDFEWIGKKIVNDDGDLIAGCFVGVNFWNMALIRLLWVDEPSRGQGIGSRLLLDAEREAKEKGACLALVDARDWNVAFFQKAGYTVYCTLEDHPNGYRKYKMQKQMVREFGKNELL